MRDLINQLYDCEVVQWDEYDGDSVVFSAIQHGQLIVADSLELFILALAPIQHERLAA